MRRSGAGVILLCTALGGCGGGSDEGMTSGTDGGAIAALAGLYDLTVTIDGATDIGYIEIRNDSTLVRHDYQQDDYGSGANCAIVTGPVRIVPLGEDRYAIDLPGDPQELTLLPGDGGGLYIAEERQDTLNGFPQVITVADEYPRVTAFTAAGIPRCG